jgi:hypothetical protein
MSQTQTPSLMDKVKLTRLQRSIATSGILPSTALTNRRASYSRSTSQTNIEEKSERRVLEVVPAHP